MYSNLISTIVCLRGGSLIRHFEQMKKKGLLAFGLMLTVLVTGCESKGVSSEAKSEPQYTVLYQGDSPEAGRWKGLGMCTAAAVASDMPSNVDYCKHAFNKSFTHNN